MMIKLNHCVSVNGILNIHNYHLFRRAGYHVNLIPRVFIQNNSSHAVSMGFRFYPSSTWLEQFRHIVYDVLSQCRWLHFGCYIYIYIIYPCQCVYVFIELDPKTIRFPFLFLNDRTLRQSKHVMKKNYLVRWTMKTRSYKWCSHTKNHSFSWMISVKKTLMAHWVILDHLWGSIRLRKTWALTRPPAAFWRRCSLRFFRSCAAGC